MSRNYRIRKNSTRQPKVRHANRWPGLLPHQREVMAQIARLPNDAKIIRADLSRGAGKTVAIAEEEMFGLLYAKDQDAAHDDNFSLNC